jgi:hypothetical protein
MSQSPPAPDVIQFQTAQGGEMLLVGFSRGLHARLGGKMGSSGVVQGQVSIGVALADLVKVVSGNGPAERKTHGQTRMKQFGELVDHLALDKKGTTAIHGIGKVANPGGKDTVVRCTDFWLAPEAPTLESLAHTLPPLLLALAGPGFCLEAFHVHYQRSRRLTPEGAWTCLETHRVRARLDYRLTDSEQPIPVPSSRLRL